MNIKYISLAISAVLLCAAQAASADAIKLSGWWSNNGGGSATVDFTGTNLDGEFVSGLHVSGGSGGLLTTNLTTGGPSVQSWCVDMFHELSFPVTSTDTKVPGGTAGSLINATNANDLGLLYTAHRDVIDSRNSSTANTSAFQLAVWEIVNESGTSYSLSSGAFKATGTGASRAALWLSQLHDISASAYSVGIWQVSRDGTGAGAGTAWGAQDVAVFAPVATVPLSEVPVMMAAGLGLLALAVRRRKRYAVA